MEGMETGVPAVSRPMGYRPRVRAWDIHAALGMGFMSKPLLFQFSLSSCSRTRFGRLSSRILTILVSQLRVASTFSGYTTPTTSLTLWTTRSLWSARTSHYNMLYLLTLKETKLGTVPHGPRIPLMAHAQSCQRNQHRSRSLLQGTIHLSITTLAIGWEDNFFQNIMARQAVELPGRPNSGATWQWARQQAGVPLPQEVPRLQVFRSTSPVFRQPTWFQLSLNPQMTPMDVIGMLDSAWSDL